MKHIAKIILAMMNYCSVLLFVYRYDSATSLIDRLSCGLFVIIYFVTIIILSKGDDDEDNNRKNDDVSNL